MMGTRAEEDTGSVVWLSPGYPTNCWLFVGTVSQLALSNLLLLETPTVSNFRL